MMITCTLALVLLMDVSGSVTNSNFELQKQGLMQAFEDPQLQQIIVSQPDGVVVQLQQFGTFSEVMINWRHLRTPEHVRGFVAELAHMPRAEPGGTTHITEALRSGIQAFDNTPCAPEQQIIDISADGVNNVGAAPETQRDRAQDQGIQINGLPILTQTDPELDVYFRERVITPDGFVIVANGYSDFGRAIRRKLTLEIAHIDTPHTGANIKE